MYNEPTGPSLTTTGAQIVQMSTPRDPPEAMETRPGLIARITASLEPTLYPVIEALFRPRVLLRTGLLRRTGVTLNPIAQQTGLLPTIQGVTRNKEAVLPTAVRAVPVEAAVLTAVRAVPVEAVVLTAVPAAQAEAAVQSAAPVPQAAAVQAAAVRDLIQEVVAAPVLQSAAAVHQEVAAPAVPQEAAGVQAVVHPDQAVPDVRLS